jgi:hypothetical protein
MGFLGVAIVGLFVVSWIVSTVVYRWKRYDDLGVEGAGQQPDDRAKAA